VLKDDGFGTANFGLQCDICGNGGSNPFVGPVNFRMTGTAITETTAAGFTADILSGTNGLTGPVGGGPSGTPGTFGGNAAEPGTLLLMFGGAGLVLLFRKRLKVGKSLS
jgi:hypothetical protein